MTMNCWIRHARGARRLLVPLLLCALAVRVLIPAGFMPVAMDGKIVVKLCSGYGPASVVIDLGKPTPDKPHKAADMPCAFAGGFASALPPVSPPGMPVPMIGAMPTAHGAAIADLTVHRLAAPPPPAIGPPRNV